MSTMRPLETVDDIKHRASFAAHFPSLPQRENAIPTMRRFLTATSGPRRAVRSVRPDSNVFDLTIWHASSSRSS